MIRSASVVPISRPFSRTSIATGDFTDSQPDTGPAVAVDTGASTEEVTPAWMTTLLPHRRAAVGLQHDLVLARREIRHADGRDAVLDAVDGDARARGIRLHQQAAGRRRFGQLEILRHFGAGRHRRSGITRGTPRPRSSTMCEPASSERRAGVLPRDDAVDEHRHAGRIGLHRQRAGLRRRRLAVARAPRVTPPSPSATTASAMTAMRRQRAGPPEAARSAGPSPAASPGPCGPGRDLRVTRVVRRRRRRRNRRQIEVAQQLGDVARSRRGWLRAIVAGGVTTGTGGGRPARTAWQPARRRDADATTRQRAPRRDGRRLAGRAMAPAPRERERRPEPRWPAIRS